MVCLKCCWWLQGRCHTYSASDQCDCNCFWATASRSPENVWPCMRHTHTLHNGAAWSCSRGVSERLSDEKVSGRVFVPFPGWLLLEWREISQGGGQIRGTLVSQQWKFVCVRVCMFVPQRVDWCSEARRIKTLVSLAVHVHYRWCFVSDLFIFQLMGRNEVLIRGCLSTLPLLFSTLSDSRSSVCVSGNVCLWKVLSKST